MSSSYPTYTCINLLEAEPSRTFTQPAEGMKGGFDDPDLLEGEGGYGTGIVKDRSTRIMKGFVLQFNQLHHITSLQCSTSRPWRMWKCISNSNVPTKE